MQIFDCEGVGTPDPHIVQGSTVHQKTHSGTLGSQQLMVLSGSSKSSSVTMFSKMALKFIKKGFEIFYCWGNQNPLCMYSWSNIVF